MNFAIQKLTPFGYAAKAHELPNCSARKRAELFTQTMRP
jgi:hypothetical protein